MDFTAIDFETANRFRGSPCSVGLVRVRNGAVIDSRNWLIQPPVRVDYFHPYNISIHGITPDSVKNAPRFNAILPEIMSFVGSDVVVAHNAAFDIGVIRDACDYDGITWPEINFLCTLVLARRALSLPSYRLPHVAETLGYELANHHDALADAVAAAKIANRLANKVQATSLKKLATSFQVKIGHLSENKYSGSVAIHPSRSSIWSNNSLIQPPLNPDADPDGYLYNRVVVFTGELLTMTRQEAWEECARLGAYAEKSVTKRTNILVLGNIDTATLRPGAKLTGKAQRAFTLQEKGQDIEIMTEDSFLQCLHF